MLSEMLIANMEVGWVGGVGGAGLVSSFAVMEMRTRGQTTDCSNYYLILVMHLLENSLTPASNSLCYFACATLCVRLVGCQVHIHFGLMYPGVPVNTHLRCICRK